MMQALLVLAVVLQGMAVVYGIVLLRRHRALAAWLCLLGAMSSMLAWRVLVATGMQPSPEFNLLIAIWGSTCMLAAMYHFGREVARREAAETERDALLDRERALRQEAEQASQVKDEFLATLSHELRTPLTAILGWCALLKTRWDRTELERGVDVIERNARTQARLVEDLLDATRIQAGKLELDLVPMPLEVPVRAAVDAIRPAAAQKQVSLHLEARGDVPVVAADALRLQQIAGNLLVNAVKFTPAGGTVRATIRQDNGRAQLVVADTGEGIAPDFLPHVFTRFRQADRFAGRRHGGLGLGLSIVSSLARLHGGSVRAESAGLGSGSVFTVDLPLADESWSQAAAPAVPDPPVAAGSLDGFRLLVVDDEADVRTMLAELLQGLGGEVTAVASASDVDRVLVNEVKPQVLLVDISMPGEDGYSLMRRIRARTAAEGGDIPAISLTAHARNEDRARALASGFQDHQPKPVDVPSLVASIRALVRAPVPAAMAVAAEPPRSSA